MTRRFRNMLLDVTLAGILVIGYGCGRESEEARKIRGSFSNIGERSKTEGLGHEFGIGIVEHIAEIKDRDERAMLYDEFVEEIFSMEFDAREYVVRSRQLSVFCELANVCFSYVNVRGGSKCDILRLWLRMLARLSREKLVADGLSCEEKPPILDKTKTSYVRGPFIGAKRYAMIVGGKLNRNCNTFEEMFNRINENGLSPNEKYEIQSMFRNIIGREIRTEEQIEIDRQKKIEEDRKNWRKDLLQ